MQSYQLTATAVQDRLQLGFAWQPALGYAVMAVVFMMIAATHRGFEPEDGTETS